MAKKIKAKGDDLGTGRAIRELIRNIDDELKAAVRDVSDDAELIFQAYALRNTGRLARGIRAIVSGLTAVVRADARDPSSGYDYVGVTRFGHRLRRIIPRHPDPSGRYLAPIPNVGPRWVDKKAALAIRVGRRILYRASSRGFHPTSDWAARALPEIKTAADERMALAAENLLRGL